MKVKPKEVLLNLPIVLQFETMDEINQFASNINTLINGKVKVKVDLLGILAKKEMAIFYLNRNDEFSELRNEFKQMIELEEITNHNVEHNELLKPENVSISKEDKVELKEAIDDMRNEGGISGEIK